MVIWAGTLRRSALLGIFCSLSTLAGSGLGATPRADELAVAAAQPLSRVGPGDDRTDYQSSDYRSNSRSLSVLTGHDAALEALAANPPLGLPALPDPPLAARIALGRRLFFERRLSANNTLSCGMCHVPEQAFTQNELATPVGIEGAFVKRNAPALFNVGYRPVLFHDGRETKLEAQVWAPLLAANEMGNVSRTAVIERLTNIDFYRNAFAAEFADGLTELNLGAALAAYQRALLSADSPFDRWFYGGDTHAVEPAVKRGFELFRNKDCGSCHVLDHRAAHFTDDDFHNTGVAARSARIRAQPPTELQIAPGVKIPITIELSVPHPGDDGRAEITGEPTELRKFRTPSLRNVALTAPYMHDGSLPTLAAVVDFYNAGGGVDEAKDALMRPLGMTSSEEHALVAFLESLTGANTDALAADARTAPIGDPE